MRSFIATLAFAMVQASNPGKSVEDLMKVTDYPEFKYTSYKQSQLDQQGLSTIDITIDGQPQTKYVLSRQCTGKKADYTCPLNSRGFIYNKPAYDIESPDYFAPKLLGGSIEWDVNMSKAACGTINSFYMVSMPTEAEQAKSIGDGYYYCDSFMGIYGGQSCPEIDLMEAN